MDKFENKRLNTPLTHKFTCVDLNGYIFPFVRLCLTKPLHSHSPINPCKGNQIPEPRKRLLLESKIKQIFSVESGIPLMSGIQNPSSTDKIPGIQLLESRIHGVDSRIQDSVLDSGPFMNGGDT